jgi:transposase
LQLLTRHYRRKLFIILDNGPWHRLDEAGREWLARNRHRIELHRLPPYSPEFNPTEGVWKTTRRRTTHNRFYPTVDARNMALANTFAAFRRRPSLIAAHVARFQ